MLFRLWTPCGKQAPSLVPVVPQALVALQVQAQARPPVLYNPMRAESLSPLPIQSCSNVGHRCSDTVRMLPSTAPSVQYMNKESSAGSRISGGSICLPHCCVISRCKDCGQGPLLSRVPKHVRALPASERVLLPCWLRVSEQKHPGPSISGDCRRIVRS